MEWVRFMVKANNNIHTFQVVICFNFCYLWKSVKKLFCVPDLTSKNFKNYSGVTRTFQAGELLGPSANWKEATSSAGFRECPSNTQKCWLAHCNCGNVWLCRGWYWIHYKLGWPSKFLGGAEPPPRSYANDEWKSCFKFQTNIISQSQYVSINIYSAQL